MFGRAHGTSLPAASNALAVNSRMVSDPGGIVPLGNEAAGPDAGSVGEQFDRAGRSGLAHDVGERGFTSATPTLSDASTVTTATSIPPHSVRTPECSFRLVTQRSS